MSIASYVSKMVSAIALASGVTLASAASPALPGANVITFPYVKVPFLQSYTIISSGKKIDGGCEFPLDSTAPTENLPSGQHYITVQRAFDPDTCQELLEKGIVDLNINPEARDLLSLPDQSSANTFIQQKALGSPVNAAAAASSSKSGKVRVWFTDKKNPTIATVNGLGVKFDGFLLSSNQIDATYSQSNNCQSISFDAKLTEQLGLIGWYRDSATVLGLTLACGYGLASVSAVHANKTQFEPFFDCRNLIKISYSPMRLRVNASAPNTLEGSVAVTGAFNRCGEYAQRFQDGPQ